MEWSTPDLCDAHADVSVLAPLFRSFGGRSSFHGRLVTVRCHEDNSRVRELAGTDGHGKVMVVDGGGSLRRALLGDLIAANEVLDLVRGLGQQLRLHDPLRRLG